MSDRDEVHVTPDWQDHDLFASCWCQPIYEEDAATGGRVWVHRAALDDPHRYGEHNDPALRKRNPDRE